jgi:hypothetical protein
MSKTTPEQPEQKRFEDHAVIVPPHRLKDSVMHTGEPGDIAMDVVERAESALSELKGEFNGWMQAECDRLEVARKSLHHGGLSKATMEIAYRASHDIHGDASTLGFPLAGRLAGSLCRLLHHAPNRSRIPLFLVDRHVDAIRAVVRENVRDPYQPTGLELAERLATLVEMFLAHELKDAYAEIAADAAPALEIPELSQ